MMNSTRRGFLTGMASLFAAPAIVHSGNLMPIKVLPFESYMQVEGLSFDGERVIRKIFEDNSRPDAFVGIDFFDKYKEATRDLRSVVNAVVTNREEEKKMRFATPAMPRGHADLVGTTPDWAQMTVVRHHVEPTKFVMRKADFEVVAIRPGEPFYYSGKHDLEANGYWPIS